MKVKVLKESDNELKIEIEEVSHTLLNILQKTLLEDSRIEVAGYHIPHPLIDKGILYVHTKEQQNPKTLIIEANKKILKLSKDLQKSFKKASKDWK